MLIFHWKYVCAWNRALWLDATFKSTEKKPNEILLFWNTVHQNVDIAFEICACFRSIKNHEIENVYISLNVWQTCPSKMFICPITHHDTSMTPQKCWYSIRNMHVFWNQALGLDVATIKSIEKPIEILIFWNMAPIWHPSGTQKYRYCFGNMCVCEINHKSLKIKKSKILIFRLKCYKNAQLHIITSQLHSKLLIFHMKYVRFWDHWKAKNRNCWNVIWIIMKI